MFLTSGRWCAYLLKFTTREGSKAAYGDLFRIESVIFVTKPGDATSKRRDGQERGTKKQTQCFDSVFKQACDNVERKDISYTASGYTKDGMAYQYLDQRREYVR